MTITIHLAPDQSLEDAMRALAEGEHDLGDDATLAGAALTQWVGRDCPWFVPHPSPCGALGVSEFGGFDLIR